MHYLYTAFCILHMNSLTFILIFLTFYFLTIIIIAAVSVVPTVTGAGAHTEVVATVTPAGWVLCSQKKIFKQ